ncbi:MAG TPA: beta-L-arabinofuranosidase domain-containing protein [Pirellulales bacterium]|nr:beta-L-arabinofuranosidase domain-containing protein [Pirellulales bacterium]
MSDDPLSDEIRIVKQIAPGDTNLYTSSREPLEPSRLIKLPIGSIVPRGWLRGQLELEARGLTGHLTEISPWCRFEKNAWTDTEGHGHSGWEELPYWLKGYGDLGYVLRDQAIIDEARRWIEAVLTSQRDDGWFGPRSLLTSLDGKADLWPNMPMLNVVQSYYEYSNDPRVLPFMTKYFRWELACPEKDFLVGYWPKIRGGDNLESVYWLYTRTGDPWLLDLADKIHRRTADWASGVINWHGVNIAQGFREPGVFYQQAKDSKFLAAAERNYRAVMDLYGQVPGGGYGADENCRPGFGDPRQGFETCSMVEFMHSFEMLTKISGDPRWSDRCEDVAFNSLPAAQTPDLKALHYLTSPNMVQLDKGNKSPGIENGGTMFSYSPLEVYRCCQHNVSHGWPYYAEELWLASSDGGLCASLYAASEVTAKVADGAEVKVVEESDYPFSDAIQLKIAATKPVRFPLYLRVPGWCGKPAVGINAEPKPIDAQPDSYIAINRTWRDGDLVRLQLPMKVGVRKWPKNHDSVSVDYGPLTFSLAIGERWSRYGGSDQWPEQEVFAATPWNYGLVLDDQDPSKSFEVVRNAGPIARQPFTADAAPVRIKAKGRRIPQWQQDPNGLIQPLQASPAQSKEPIETISLIPMGAARLRIAAFPTVGDGGGTHAWSLLTQPSGAPVAFTSQDPLIAQARQFVDSGEFAKATKLLDSGHPADARASDVLREVIERIRVAYTTDADAMLAKLKQSIPDVTAEDLERWRKAGQLQSRTIDGRVWYFNREPANLFRFCDEAIRRRTPAADKKPAWRLEDHLARVIAATKDGTGPEVVPIRQRITYSLTVPASAPGFKPGAVVRVWLPFPQEYRQQKDVKLVRSSPKYGLLAESSNGNPPTAGAAQRTLYFEERVHEPPEPMTFEEVFEFTSSAYYPVLDDAKAVPLPADYSEGDLGERPPHIRFTPEVRETVARIVDNETNPLAKARRIFHFVSNKIAYCAEEEYSTMPSLSTKALASYKGDCGVHAMLFITLCRAAGIPARWQSGWATERVGLDMHDWAEFYVAPWGWLPCDANRPPYGLQDSDDPAIREFYFGHLDSYRLIVNRDYGRDLVPPKQSLRSETLDFQRGEVEIDGKNLYYPHWDYDIHAEWLKDGP